MKTVVIKFVWSLVALVFALVPFWLWLLAYNILSPGDFWQKLVVYGLGLYLLGGVQIILLLALLYVLFKIWF